MLNRDSPLPLICKFNYIILCTADDFPWPLVNTYIGLRAVEIVVWYETSN